MQKTSPQLMTALALCAVIVVALTTRAGLAAAEPSTAQQLSLQPIAEDKAWRAYDESPTTDVVHPTRVLGVTGNVGNPSGLADPTGAQTTTLTYAAGGTKPSLVLDYGQEVEGKPTFTVAKTTGAGIDTQYSETLANLGNDQAISVLLFISGDPIRSETFHPSAPGVVTSSLIQGGERYEEVTLSAPGTVTLRSAGISFTAPRDTPSVIAGHFLSSDDTLNRAWWAGAYTLSLNQLAPGTPVLPGAVNKLHLIMDGAKRDRAVWSGDHAISDLTDYYVSDPAYARDSLALFLTHPATVAGEAVPAVGLMALPGPLPGACSPNPLTGNLCVSWSASYSIAVIPAVWNYYLYTGDLSFVRAHWAAVARQMAWDAQQVDANGLFRVTSADGEDWNVEKTSGELTYVNALYVQALRSASQLATALGLSSQASKWAAAAHAVTTAVNANLWNPSTGVYDTSTALRGSVVQDANVTAILAGVASAQQAASILGVLPVRLATPYGLATVGTDPAPAGYIRVVSPYMGSFNVLADFASGNSDAALRLIRQEWGYMLSQDPGGVTWERIQPDGVPAGGLLADSTAHAWSTGPTSALSRYVVGIAPTTPGYARWSVAPQTSGLVWAQGVSPTPHGPISVRWARTTRSFHLTVQAPAGTSGAVSVPLIDASADIARNGKIVWSNGSPRAGVDAHRVGDAIVFTEGSVPTTFAETS
ncbi:MAG TPA: alpha-L-rhamnosidase C-terminal domain-containing protein [Marmoricola sp.]|nr:alpha-L-rhamnosidase C-terminal domain-containing protein [Marmoricola sp.]